jgi:uncharacterized membrane protein YtjA (UPF0391 family)
MLRASLILFAISLLALVSGLQGTSGLSLETGRFAFFILLGLAILTFLGALITGQGSKA